MAICFVASAARSLAASPRPSLRCAVRSSHVPTAVDFVIEGRAV
jgi:hypothetical protein